MAVTCIGNYGYTIRHVISQHNARELRTNYADPVSMADSLRHSNIRHNPFDIHNASVAVSTLVSDNGQFTFDDTSLILFCTPRSQLHTILPCLQSLARKLLLIPHTIPTKQRTFLAIYTTNLWPIRTLLQQSQEYTRNFIYIYIYIYIYIL